MNCVSTALGDFLFMLGVLLNIGAVVGLAFALVRDRQAALGRHLLEACENDWDAAAIAIDNARREIRRARSRR